MRNVVKTTLVMDIECYKDYFLVMFRRVDADTTRVYEQFEGQTLNADEIRRIMSNYRVVTFNGNDYDFPMLNYALRGATCAQLKQASDAIIVSNMRGWQFEQQYNLKTPTNWDHVDLIEVAFGQGSLKLYGGRLHSKKLQDLPIEPDASINVAQRAELVAYCGNDLQTTIDLWNHLKPQIELRELMGAEYGQDLRSKSDAQIAEALIRKQVSQIIGQPVQRPSIPPGTAFKYQPPKWLAYKTDAPKAILSDVLAADFFVTAEGGVNLPPALDGRSVAIGNSVYRMGIGGLHSSEQCQALVSNDEFVLIDRDVTSYYPAIILEGNLSPVHLRERDGFIRVFRSIVERRVAAKRAASAAKSDREVLRSRLGELGKDGVKKEYLRLTKVLEDNEVVANALKIVANGSFGKLGSKYSALYSPHLMIQVTLTGQLALLMLIESLEARGIRVVSGNTDGIVIHCQRAREHELLDVIGWWERTTSFNTEETRYRAVFSRDVNNYVALKEGGGAKGKGAFAPVSIAKNPQNIICNEAVIALLDKGVPIEQTIRSCTDIRKFVTVRTVRGGGVQMLSTRYDDSLTPGRKRDALLAAGCLQVVPGPLSTAKFDWVPDGCGYDVETAYRIHCGEDNVRYLGKVVRFYIGHSSLGAIYYKDKNKTGGRNKVPKSDCAVPVMELPDTLPNDINYEHYIREANDILNDIGASQEKLKQLWYGQLADLF